MQMLLTAADVAGAVRVPEARVRYWAQTGLVGPSARPNGRAAYTFADLVCVHVAETLLGRGASAGATRQAVHAVRTALPGSAPGARLCLVERGGGLELLAEPAAAAAAELALEIDLGALEQKLAERMGVPATARRAEAPGQSTYSWFRQGLEREQAGDDDGARAAYKHALAGEPALPSAHTNLGNLLYRRSDLRGARRAYEQALALEPAQAEARYNLANILDELGEREQALVHWYRALFRQPRIRRRPLQPGRGADGDRPSTGAATPRALSRR